MFRLLHYCLEVGLLGILISLKGLVLDFFNDIQEVVVGLQDIIISILNFADLLLDVSFISRPQTLHILLLLLHEFAEIPFNASFHHLLDLSLQNLLNPPLQTLTLTCNNRSLDDILETAIDHLLQRILLPSHFAIHQLLLYTLDAFILIDVLVLQRQVLVLDNSLEGRTGGERSVGICLEVLFEVGCSLGEGDVYQRTVAVLLAGLLGHNDCFLQLQLQLYIGLGEMTGKQVLAFLLVVVAMGRKDGYFWSPLDLYVTDRNVSVLFQQVVERKEMVGILFTNKHCRQCYLYEQELASIINNLWKRYKVSTYRAELVENPELQEEFNIKRFPMLHFVLPHNNRYLVYHNYDILTWNLVEKSIIELQNGLKRFVFDEEHKHNALFMNIDKLYFLEEEEILEHYIFQPVYSNLPSIIVSQNTDHRKMLITDQISQSELDSCLIYQRTHKKCFTPTSAHEVAFILSVINHEKVIQFNQKTYKAYQQLQLDRYIFIAVLDSIIKRQDSQAYLNMLNELLQRREFKSRITIFWMETGINKQKLTHLGFKETHLPPLFSQFDLANAQKKILTNKKNQPIFGKEAIVKFIKDIMQFDEQREIERQNQQVLEESLKRLKIDRQYKLIDLKKFKPDDSSYFLLSFPVIELQLLGDNQIFYKMIMNYRYLIERVNRFADKKITINYLTFDKYNCESLQNHGIFFIQNQQCIQLSSKIIFDQETASIILQNLLKLPDFFWINQDQYEDHLLETQTNLPIFKYHYLDV